MKCSDRKRGILDASSIWNHILLALKWGWLIMRKVIRLAKREFRSNLRNHAVEIDNKLTIAMDMVVFKKFPLRKKFGEYICQQSKWKSGCVYEITRRDIKRLESPNKCEISVNIVDFLEIVITEIVYHKDSFKSTYKVSDDGDSIVSMYMLRSTIEQVRLFRLWLADNENTADFANNQYRDEAQYIADRLAKFDKEHPGTFNLLLESVVKRRNKNLILE